MDTLTFRQEKLGNDLVDETLSYNVKDSHLFSSFYLSWHDALLLEIYSKSNYFYYSTTLEILFLSDFLIQRVWQ